jgi:hypothetical protein
MDIRGKNSSPELKAPPPTVFFRLDPPKLHFCYLSMPAGPHPDDGMPHFVFFGGPALPGVLGVPWNLGPMVAVDSGNPFAHLVGGGPFLPGCFAPKWGRVPPQSVGEHAGCMCVGERAGENIAVRVGVGLYHQPLKGRGWGRGSPTSRPTPANPRTLPPARRPPILHFRPKSRALSVHSLLLRG